MRFEGTDEHSRKSAAICNVVVNDVINTMRGKDPNEFQVYLGRNQYYALCSLDLETRMSIQFDPPNKKTICGAKIFIVNEDDHFMCAPNVKEGKRNDA